MLFKCLYYYYLLIQIRVIFKIVLGIIAPTSGTAIVNDRDIKKQTTAVKQSLGICAQQDALWDQITVEEHLAFYAGVSLVDHC